MGLYLVDCFRTRLTWEDQVMEAPVLAEKTRYGGFEHGSEGRRNASLQKSAKREGVDGYETGIPVVNQVGEEKISKQSGLVEG